MTLPFPIRDAVREFTPYTPGRSIGEIQKQYGLSSVIKMASNENPLGASPLVVEEINRWATSVFRYAQSGNPDFVVALGEHLGVGPEQIVIGNGSDEVIDLLIRTCPTPGVHSVVTCRPCFSLYSLQSRFCGVELRQVDLKEDFSFDWEGLRAAVDESTALVFLTTPDNPSGYCPPIDRLRSFVRSLPQTCLIVIDEAYMDFCDNSVGHSLFHEFAEYPNIAILRTFSKLYGLAGLRLGYGVMPRELAKILCTVRPPFSVNILAEHAGMAALQDVVFKETTLQTVREGRKYLTQELDNLGFKVYPSQANFLMVDLPVGCTASAQDVFEGLLPRGIIIRPLASYGLPEKLRISIGTMRENMQFIKHVTEIIGKVE